MHPSTLDHGRPCYRSDRSERETSTAVPNHSNHSKVIPNRRVGDDTGRKGIADGYLSLPELSAAKADRRDSAQQEAA